MKKSLSSVLMILALLGAQAPVVASAKTCSVDIFKTYTARVPGFTPCDDKNLPADFAGDLTTLMDALKKRGYTTQKYDQCENGYNDPAEYALISQLGNCVQSGASMHCQLYVGLYENKTNKALYENTIKGAGVGSVTLHLSDALQKLPDCSNL